jgi:hypothetical protein
MQKEQVNMQQKKLEKPWLKSQGRDPENYWTIFTYYIFNLNHNRPVIFYCWRGVSSTPQGKLFTGPEYSLKDEELIKFYKKVADKNNKRDRWLVPYGRRKDGKTWLEAVSTDIIIKEKMPQYYDKVLKEEDIRSIALSGYAPPRCFIITMLKRKDIWLMKKVRLFIHMN